MINLRNALMTGRTKEVVTKSMRAVGGSMEGFMGRNLGTMPVPVTITAWYKFSGYTAISYSKSTFKYGNRNNGGGFGVVKNYSPSFWGVPAAVVEGKYWVYYKKFTSLPTDTSWHYVGLKIISGITNPILTAFIDGSTVTAEQIGGTAAIINPTQCFSICGKDNGSSWEDPRVTATASRVCIFSGALSDAELQKDMALGGLLPTNTNLIHFYDGTVESNALLDKVGNWDLSQTNGCSIVDETPWS